jgi:hypothetical protein
MTLKHYTPREIELILLGALEQHEYWNGELAPVELIVLRTNETVIVKANQTVETIEADYEIDPRDQKDDKEVTVNYEFRLNNSQNISKLIKDFNDIIDNLIFKKK